MRPSLQTACFGVSLPVDARAGRTEMAMFDDDLPAAPEQPFPRKLDSMSIESLREYIRELETEIARVKKEVENKVGLRDEATKIFKK